MECNEYITKQFRARFMGLVCDNTDTIGHVYTAVFPSQAVIDKILADNKREALLFVHHPMTWDINNQPAFSDISVRALKQLRERKISIYNLHVPLDANGAYSTTHNLALALGIQQASEFLEYGGAYVGIIGTTACQTVSQLKRQFEAAVGHEVALYAYGDETIVNNTVALAAGGGNMETVYAYLREQGIHTYVTGIASMRSGFPPAIEAHAAAKSGNINILAGTHYSTEKFACIKMAAYFSKLGIHSAFLPDSPCMEDM